MKNLTQILNDYHEYHTNKTNVYTHIIGVPLIVFGVLLMLSWFNLALNPIFSISLMWLGIIAAGIYYMTLDLQLGIILTITFIVLGSLIKLIGHLEVTHLSFSIFLITFIGGWIIQFIGHYFEGRKPAFLDNILQMLAAPIFVLAEILVMLGKRQDLSWIAQKK